MNIYLICPVRNVADDEAELLREYVAALERDGHRVHYPPRDVEQTDDGCGLAICNAHREAMLTADEVHVLWNAESKGSHFDLGMAFMLAVSTPIKFRLVAPVATTPHKSYGNVLLAMTAIG